MSEDWKPGDLAVCVNAVTLIGPPSMLLEGRTYTVSGIYAAGGFSALGREAPFGLLLEGQRSPGESGSYDPERFRKVKPDTQEPCEAEFITLLNRSRKQVRA